VITDAVEERLVADKVPRAVDGVRVSARFLLGNERNLRSILTQNFGVGVFIPWPDHDADIRDTRSERFTNNQTQHRALFPLLIEQSLHRKVPLLLPRRGDHGPFDTHGLILQVNKIRPEARRNRMGS
jgi:hypothetical protein